MVSFRMTISQLGRFMHGGGRLLRLPCADRYLHLAIATSMSPCNICRSAKPKYNLFTFHYFCVSIPSYNIWRQTVATYSEQLPKDTCFGVRVIAVPRMFVPFRIPYLASSRSSSILVRLHLFHWPSLKGDDRSRRLDLHDRHERSRKHNMSNLTPRCGRYV